MANVRSRMDPTFCGSERCSPDFHEEFVHITLVNDDRAFTVLISKAVLERQTSTLVPASCYHGVTVRDVDPEIFEAFTYWLRNDKINLVSGIAASSDYFLDCNPLNVGLRLWVLGYQLDLPVLQDMTMTSMWSVLARTGSRPRDCPRNERAELGPPEIEYITRIHTTLSEVAQELFLSFVASIICHFHGIQGFCKEVYSDPTLSALVLLFINKDLSLYGAAQGYRIKEWKNIDMCYYHFHSGGFCWEDFKLDTADKYRQSYWSTGIEADVRRTKNEDRVTARQDVLRMIRGRGHRVTKRPR